MGTPAQFCEGIFHIYPADEIGVQQHGCVTGRKRDACRPFAMTLVVMTDKNFVARYTNCRRKHAEEFFVESESVKTHIETANVRSIHMFMKNHPCHHSGGNAIRFPNGYYVDTRSCAKQMCKFYRRELEPRNIKLYIHVAWLYKAFWSHAIRDDDKIAVQNSLDGLLMMLQHGIEIDAMLPCHWMQLANLCTQSIYLHHLLLQDRRSVDIFVQTFIDTQKQKLKQEKQETSVSANQ